MRVRTRGIGLAVVAAMAILLQAGEGRAASWFEKNFYLSGPRYDGVLPPCDYPQALGQIQGAFAEKESRFWNSALKIVGFEAVRETDFRPWVSGTIPRRFCSGIAQISDGIRRPIHYWIGEDTGLIGADYGVEWCVVGLDRNWAYNPACKMARP